MSEQLLNSKKEKAKNVLEVGILNGGSITLWSDYFTNANVYGIDIIHIDMVRTAYITKYGTIYKTIFSKNDRRRDPIMGEYRLMKYIKNKGWRSVECLFTSEMFNASH